MIRVGILGCSGIARRKFIPALLKCGQADLVALASRQRNTAVSLTDGLPVKVLTYQELVRDPAIDLVYISLPNHLHEEWSIQALEQGKHVICEKPLGLCSSSVNRMLDAADRHGKLLYENLMYLHHPQHRTVKDIIASGRIGRIVSLHSEFAFPGPEDGDFRLNPSMGGGAFHDLNRYPLSAARYFLSGKEHRLLRGYMKVRNGLDLSLQAESITDAGEMFSFLISFGQPYRSFYRICGEQGSIQVDRAYTTPADMENRILVAGGGREESIQTSPGDHFLGAIEHVCGLIRTAAWSDEHERSRSLAGLAEMYHTSSIWRKHDHDAE